MPTMRLNAICLSLAILVLPACQQQQPSLPQLPSEARILAFGDSLTYGTGASRDHDYPSLLVEMTGLTVINAGIPGEVSAQGLARLPSLLDEQMPELLILIHGGNDMLRKTDHAQIAENLQAMIREAHDRNISVVMMGVPSPSLFLLDSPAFYAAVAEANQVPIDLDTLPDILSDNEFKSDTIHPNDAGYRRMAKKLHELLKTSGAL